MEKRIALSSETKMFKKYWKAVTSYDDVVNYIVPHASVCDYYRENKN